VVISARRPDYSALPSLAGSVSHIFHLLAFNHADQTALDDATRGIRIHQQHVNGIAIVLPV
jgi:hypothetical protein